MGLLTFSINVTLDGCVDHREGIADDETHAFFTSLMDESGAMLWGRVTYEMMERYWPEVARGAAEAPPAIREWAVKLEAKPKYVVSSTRADFPWTNSQHIAGDLGQGVRQQLRGGASLVVVEGGLNDTDQPPADVVSGFHRLMSALRGHRVVVVGPTAAPKRGASVYPVDALLARLCAAARVPGSSSSGRPSQSARRTAPPK